MDEESIVDRINRENIEKHGPIQKCCGLVKTYCRCKTDEINWFEKRLKEAADVPEPKSFWERLMFWK